MRFLYFLKYFNRLIDIELNFALMPCLKQLHCGDNKLKALPASLGSCKCLDDLDATNNELTEIPPELSGCTALVKLNFTMNKIKFIPPDLSSCQFLRRVDMSKNPIDKSLLAACQQHREVEFIKTDEYAAVYWPATGRQRPGTVL